MISYEKAYKIAKELKSSIDRCQETTDAYVFISSKDADMDGGSEACVIMKDTGEAYGYTWYVYSTKGGGDVIREFNVKKSLS